MSDDTAEESATLENLTTRAQELRNRAQERAQDAYQVSREYVRENPVPIIVGALLIGAALGALLSQREAKEKDTRQAARDLVETAYSELLEKLPKLKKQYADTQSNLLEHAQDLGSKLKWW